MPLAGTPPLVIDWAQVTECGNGCLENEGKFLARCEAMGVEQRTGKMFLIRSQGPGQCGAVMLGRVMLDGWLARVWLSHFKNPNFQLKYSMMTKKSTTRAAVAGPRDVNGGDKGKRSGQETLTTG